jgi:GNAT superfamily N-acetyltransferase
VPPVTDPSVQPVAEDARANVYATLVSAFADDPVERWLYPTSAGYLTHFPDFLAAFGGKAFHAGAVWQLGDFSAVGLWYPPGTEPDGDGVAAVVADTVAPAKHADLFAVAEQMDTAHPTYRHWYLPWFGVRADLRGQGLGSRLLESCLETVDADRLPAYLETPNPRTLPFYERHGFTVTGQAQAGACPPIVFMLRPAR